MNASRQLLTDQIDIWTAAKAEKKSGRGRSSGNGISVYGIKKLRELILELAVRGKLVPQDPKDEPASELLKRIQAEKAKLVAEGKIKKGKLLPSLKDEEKKFELPQGWKWVRLKNIVYILGDGLHGTPIYTPDTECYFVNGNNLDNGQIIIKPETKTVSLEEMKKHRKDLNERTILVSINGTIGRAAFYNNENIVLGKSACYFNLANLIYKNFVKLLLESPYFLDYAKNSVSGTTIMNLSLFAMNNFPLAIPPLSEQHRIVAKVDELMALCDQLESQHNNAAEAHEKLVNHLLGTLTQAQSAEDFSTNWQRIAAHFDTLFTTESSIDALKQTIFELAVMGTLSYPQQSDTPITTLLEKIVYEKKSLGISKKEEEAHANEYSASLDATENNRVRLKTRFLCDFITKGTTPAQTELLVEGDVPFLKVYNIVNNQIDFDYRPIFISNDIHQTKLNRSKLYPGDVIMNIVGPPLGKIGIISDQYKEWNMNQALAVFRPLAGIYNRYLFCMLSTKSILESVLTEVKGTAGQDNLSLEQCRNLLIPIPSIEEQHRIVAKVDELMAVCDQLKTSITEANLLQQKLADGVVEQAVV